MPSVGYAYGLSFALGNRLQAGERVPFVINLESGRTPEPKVVRVYSNSFHGCAETTGGAFLCWGSGSVGRMGNGAEIGTGASQSFDPSVPVLFPPAP